ncbi:MAG: branched-chain amino acid ABC transporter permease [Candidatus Omnitrophica bacterium]|nr:branched-chain amino acid ABC transporter permease [Candidatus Omnitrophota bacterium]
MTSESIFFQQLINGLTIGAIYALIALGYTMVYGIIQLINFAHGEIFMFGGYAGLTLLLTAGVQGPVSGAAGIFWMLCAIAAGMAGCAFLGGCVERIAYRPLRRSPKLAALITAIGVSMILQNAVMLIYGARDRYVPNPLPAIHWQLGGATLTGMQMVIICTAVVVMIALHRFIRLSLLGQAMLATAQDPLAAGLMGINIHRVIASTFVIGSSLAGMGGVLFGMYYSTINFHDGYMTGLKAFTAAVLGGIGNVPGAMAGGFLLGLLEGFGAGYVSSQWKNVFAFVVLVLLLIFRPHGLLGERVAERA